MQLRQAIYAIVKDTFPYCGLYVVGSSMNGFGSITSDMDMCLMICQQEIDQHREAQQILGVVNRGLRKCAYIIDLDLIRAKVPIIKFRDKISGVECDLNVNNSVGIR
jgi:poly(A) RNA polymerase GLD2